MNKLRHSLVPTLLAVLLSADTLLTGPAPAFAAPPPSELNLQPGNVRKVLVGAGALTVRVVAIGDSGWVTVEIIEDASFFGLKKGERYWLNVNQALLIQSAQVPH